MKRISILTAVLTLASAPALAHTGGVATSGLASGFSHPIGGLDHLLAMVAVGILAAQLGGRALWMVPAAFVGMMIAGGALAMAGVSLPLVEIGIVGSIVVLGLVIAAGRSLPTGVAMALVGVLAIFHGHAHGAEMPASVGGFEYAIGFAVATALLHAAGVGVTLAVRRLSESTGPVAVRAGGGVLAALGAALFMV